MAADESIKWQLDVMRFAAGTRSKVMLILRRTQRELVGKLADGPTDWSRKRLEAMLAETKASIATHYDDIDGVVSAALDGVAPVASRAAAKGLQSSVPIRVAVGLPTAAHMRAIAGNAITQGAPIKAWWQKQAADTAFKFAAEVRQGVVAGETLAQITRRIAGGKGFAGVMDVSRREAATLVNSSIQNVAHEARLETFDENADVIEEYRWLSTLDQSVCFECAGLADRVFQSVDEIPDLPHFNCRCVVVAITSLTKQLDAAGRERSSQFGPVPSGTTFADFLGRQSEEFKETVLGPGRSELFNSGKITLNDLTNGQGKELTLAQLREKYA